MKAVYYEQFNSEVLIADLPDPAPRADGVVIRVESTGLCRSDWHGWKGHDPDIALPHVPGHELAGVVEEVGRDVRNWCKGDRVTVPFVGGCGDCPECLSGNQQVCDQQFQPGFTHWGSFAGYVAIGYADVNLVRIPDDMEYDTAAGLGCRFVTAFRAVMDQGKLRSGEWVAIHGCGGVGLSAIMIAAAQGASVVAVDIGADKLKAALDLGAVAVVNSLENQVVEAVREITGGGAHLSLDALGHPETCRNSVACLRKRGRHVQVGLLLADQAETALPMDLVVARELEIYGSHGIQAHRYDRIWNMVKSGAVDPARLVGRRISLEQAGPALMEMDRFQEQGITVIRPWETPSV